jgi:hypothetical protein
VVGGDVAADGTASAPVTCVRRRERDGQDASADFGDHQPVGGRLGRVEQRLTGPDVADVVGTLIWVLEEVNGLLIDLEGPVLGEVVDIEPVHDRNRITSVHV